MLAWERAVLRMVSTVSTAPYHGFQVAFSPYSPNKIAFIGAQNYGIAGSGVLIVYEQEQTGYRELRRYDWQDGLFDLTWSEVNEAVLVAAAGNGHVLIFDQNIPQEKGIILQGPVGVLLGHTAEVSSVQWSITRQEQFVLSSSWDSTIRLWDPQSQACVSVFSDHTGMVYEASWAPHIPHTFASVSGDETLRLWDSAHPPHSTACIRAHGGEVLACDWSKYDQNVVFTAGVDGTIRSWDIRQLGSPVLTLSGHTQAIRRVKCDPFRGNIVASCSYDFTVRLWDIGAPGNHLLDTIAHHSEFTFGLDLSSLSPGRVADCSWDRTIKVYNPQSISPQP